MVETQTTTAVPAQDSQLHEYELVLVYKPDLSDEALAGRLELITKLVTAGGGTMDKVDRWGKKRLAYPIQHYIEGIYILAKLKMKSATSRELESSIRISEDIIRHLLIKL